MAATYKTDAATNSFEDLQALILGGESGAPKKINKDKASYSVIEGQTKFTRADNKASFEDFIEMVNRMVQKALARYNVEFSSDEGSRYKVQATETLSNPHIQFSIKSRKPKNDMYAKPKAMEEFAENGDGSRKGIVYSQFFDYEIQFDILASDYITANKVMNAFEDAMFNYTGYFKRNGVSELLFLKQYTDTNLDAYRNTVSVRSLEYLVTIDRIRVVYASDLSVIAGEDQTVHQASS